MSNGVSFRRAAMLAVVAGIVAGCSSLHPFKSGAPENMAITTDARSVSVQMDVYSVDSKCEASYQGTVDLSDKKVRTGIPANKLSYLVFYFGGGSYFTGYHSTSYAIYLTPRPGYHYDATASYADGMYGATIYERDAHGGGRRKIPFIEHACASRN